MPATPITPVTVLTGFLGSGKTTLLNAVLSDGRYSRAAVVVNEWGEIPIDHALVRKASENVVTLAGGCICCRVAGELVSALRELHFQRASGAIGAFERVVIETSGLADPAPLLATLVEMPVVAARYVLSGVVTTVDAEHGAAILETHPESIKQVAVADRLVVTKVDRAQPPVIEALEVRLGALNPAAPRVRAVQGALDAAWLFDTGLHRSSGRIDASGWLNAGAYRRAGTPSPHSAGIASFVWSSDAPVDPEAFGAALETLFELFGDRILRMKGLVHVAGESGPMAVHAVQHTIYPPAWLDAWPDEDRRTRLVFIARGLEEAAIAPILNSFVAPDVPNPSVTPSRHASNR